MAGVEPLTVMDLEEFMLEPSLMYGLFYRLQRSSSLEYDREHVVMMTDVGKRTLQVNTVEELTNLADDLMSKYILFFPELMFRRTQTCLYVTVTTTWEARFAVLLNARHPLVREPMAEMFRKGVQSLARGEQFCLEFDLGPSLRAWYGQMVRADAECGCIEKKSSGARFYVTNSSKYLHCFDCNRYWFLFGFSCWLLSAPCYMINRARTVTDIVHRFDLPVALLTSVDNNTIVLIIPLGGNRQEVIVMSRRTGRTNPLLVGEEMTDRGENQPTDHAEEDLEGTESSSNQITDPGVNDPEGAESTGRDSSQPAGFGSGKTESMVNEAADFPEEASQSAGNTREQPTVSSDGTGNQSTPAPPGVAGQPDARTENTHPL